MAKWGEGDPRWIVEERPDATNVNNWHWVEKDATQWSKDKLKSLLTELQFGDKEGNSLEVEEVNFGDECEAVINNRKQKLIFLYEFFITLKTTGYTAENDKVTGKIEIPNLEQQEPLEDVNIDFSQETPKSTEVKYYNFFKSQVRPFIREKLGMYINALKEEYSKGLVKPTKETLKSSNTQKLTSNAGDKTAFKSPESSGNKTFDVCGLRISTFKMELKETFQATSHDVMEAFLDKPRVEAFTGGPAQIDRSKGGAFALFDKNVTGYFDSIDEKCLKMRWRKKDWPAEHYSLVTINLTEADNETHLSLSHTLIPSPQSNEEEMTRGWKMMYFQPMKQKLALGFLL